MAQSAPQAELPKGEAAFKFLENILAPPCEIIGSFPNAVQECVDRGLGLSQFRGDMIDSLVSKTVTVSRGWTGMKVATLYFAGEECLLS
jgi:hypothetical protein